MHVCVCVLLLHREHFTAYFIVHSQHELELKKKKKTENSTDICSIDIDNIYIERDSLTTAQVCETRNNERIQLHDDYIRYIVGNFTVVVAIMSQPMPI